MGDAAHVEIARFKSADLALPAGFRDGIELKNGLKVAGSSFLDVLHDVGNGTIYIFDIKTGISGLGSRQIYRYWSEAKQAFVYAQRIYILEVRP